MGSIFHVKVGAQNRGDGRMVTEAILPSPHLIGTRIKGKKLE